MGENSSVRMIDNRLVSTRVDILSGNVILESDDPQMDVKDSPVVLLYKDYEIRMVKHGLAEINSDPGQLKVFKGEVIADVTLAERASDAQLTAIKDALHAVTSRDVQVEVKVEPAIIGGLIVKLGSRMVDSSLRTKLRSLKHAMKEVS